MDSSKIDPVARVMGQLLRHPEPQRDVELQRGLAMLQSARSDSAYLLLHRVMVLEAALQQLKQHAASAAPATQPPAAAGPLATSRPRSFMRDAAVVAAGVMGAQVLWQGLSDVTGVGSDTGVDAGVDTDDGLGFDLEF